MQRLDRWVRAVSVGATPRFERNGGGNNPWVRQVGAELGVVGEGDRSCPHIDQEMVPRDIKG
jgi:hypothetical protein